MPRIAFWRGSALVLATAALAAGTGRAESDLLMDYPGVFGPIPASTYDVDRKQVGKARLVIENLGNGNVRISSESGFTGGARTIASAELVPAEDGHKLRPVLQESRSVDPEGNALGTLSIDHVKGIASCRNPDGETREKIPLPSNDRVANVPLNLLFLPLVRHEKEEIAFQFFMCGGRAHFMDFVANLAPSSRNGKPPQKFVEVRYAPDFGIATLVAQNFVPKLSFWFDPEAPHRWMAHRLPLYGKGPEVFVVRDGVPTHWLGDN
jgi:hypothetical protein